MRLFAILILWVVVFPAQANDLEMHGVPEKYWELRNPLKPTDDNIGDGKALFEAFCVRCHGLRGMGNGPDSQNFNPPPAPLGYTINMPVSTDPFLFWSIVEGGHEFGTAMPDFEKRFEVDEIWKIILYLRSGFMDLGKDE